MRIVYWGTYDLGKPRNRILLHGLREKGVEVVEIHADVWKGIDDKSSIRSLGGKLGSLLRWLASYPRLLVTYVTAPSHDAVVVGYPGYLDVLVIWPLACLKRRPIVWDAFMSLYGTVVEDRRMLRPGSLSAKFVYLVEWLACRAATTVVLDTDAHARYFVERYGVDPDRVSQIFVGAELEAFPPDTSTLALSERPLILFYGQFIPLHGIETILCAAMSAEGANFDWILIGKGQEEARIRSLLGDRIPGNIEWIPWVDYQDLQEYIQKADVCLGIFGDTQKAAQVIPNKVFQALAAGKPVLTRDSPATRELLNEEMDGVYLVPPADSAALLAALQKYGAEREALAGRHPLHRELVERIGPSGIGGEFRELIGRHSGRRKPAAAN